MGDAYEEQIEGYERTIATLTRERDAWKAEAEGSIKTGATLADSLKAQFNRADGLERERDAARRERDDARTLAGSMAKLHERGERDNDALRAEVARLREALSGDSRKAYDKFAAECGRRMAEMTRGLPR